MSAFLHEPLRGEIWFAGFDPVVGHEQGGDRPCLVSLGRTDSIWGLRHA